MKWLLTQLLNEGMADDEPELNEKQVGKLLHIGNLQEVMREIMIAFAVNGTGHTPEADDEEEPEDDPKNAGTGKAS